MDVSEVLIRHLFNGCISVIQMILSAIHVQDHLYIPSVQLFFWSQYSYRVVRQTSINLIVKQNISESTPYYRVEMYWVKECFSPRKRIIIIHRKTGNDTQIHNLPQTSRVSFLHFIIFFLPHSDILHNYHGDYMITGQRLESRWLKSITCIRTWHDS